MKRLLFPILLLLSLISFSQKLKKADKQLMANLKTHVAYLADDKLEGRRTGTSGEKLAYEYIISAFEKYKIEPKGENNSYLQAFEVNDGKSISASTYFFINGSELTMEKDFFPMAWTANASVESMVSPSLPEKSVPWFYDVKDLLEKNKDNPHYDLESALIDEASNFAKRGATALILYNSSSLKDNLSFDAKNKTAAAAIPVVYINKNAFNKHIKNISDFYEVKLKTELSEKKRTGHNVVGYINNGAVNTVILGAHFDHLGYGEDNNSMYRGPEKLIHNGADDNASGTAALLELSRILKKGHYKNNNYLLIAFSGEELGLYGSKYFTEHPTIDLSKVTYMFNMDMVGRLNDSTHGLTVGGYGTSPTWGELITPDKEKFYQIKIDSAGTGPSDHTSFYKKNIPVLFFFTGTHSDYHKPSDDADKINYKGETLLVKYIVSLIEKLNDRNDKLVFTKTREQQSARASFSVSMGIMPDYTYSGAGVKVDGVSDNRPAKKAGIEVGDVITQLGEHKVSSVETYMQALSKFKKGDKTTVKFKRGNEEKESDIQF
jgi:Zn-dependent M28 family amino/carboxypeptidase